MPLAMVAASAATRPHYGGTLRIEIRQAVQAPEAVGVTAGFVITNWDPGLRAVFSADDNAPGGRPFLDSIDIEMARPLRDQSVDLELGKTDLVELGPNELRRQAAGRRVWSSSPVRLMALVFGPRVDDTHVREALALTLDRAALNVLLQRQGEISGALLPQWLSGYAFLFGAEANIAKARALVGELPAAARSLSLAVDDPSMRALADRITLNARDGGLTVTVVAANSNPDVRLAEARIGSSDPARALAGIAAALGLGEPPKADTAEALYAAERALLEGFRVIPLFHLPDVYGVSPRVKGGPGITPLGEWRFENLWVEDRP
ncbi:MAG TPA: ABC transporter substrate-binding protein [Bryobacteraceae bacterium]|nr:ABC transporter substrate-binding protein [Bryobacteraceae bacterium]